MKRTSVLLNILLFSGFLQAHDYSFSPAQMPELKRLLGSGELRSGDRVILQDGTYTGWDCFDFHAWGTAGAPVMLTAQNPGKAILSGAMHMRIYALFYHCDGENETISVKSCENIVRRNLFYETRDSSDVNTNIQVSNPAVFPGIQCLNNYMSFKTGTDFKMEGFTLLPFSFEKQTVGAFKGLYLLRNGARMEVADGFDYIRDDATGAPRTDKFTAGAVQLVSMSRRFNIVSFDDCGTGWYVPMKKDIEDILQKTSL